MDIGKTLSLWSTPRQANTYMEGWRFVRHLFRSVTGTPHELIGYRELFYLKRHPEKIPEEWWGKRIYALHPRSIKRGPDGFRYAFCLSLVDRRTPRLGAHAIVTNWFTKKDFVGVREETTHPA